MCPTCLTANVYKCTEVLIFDVALEGDTQVVVVFETSQKTYQLHVITEIDGSVNIDVADLPDGLLASYSNIKVFFTLTSCNTPLPFTINDVEYECITLLMQDCDSIIASQTIPCV